jgi:NAD(P)-dependent dehydrogenase (short-subunit alcohol dehydrogenase family)
MRERRTVFITGSTAGLGMAAAKRLLARGHRVILHGRDRARAEEAARAIANGGTESPDWVVSDLGSVGSVRAMAAELRERFPELDVLINNAAISNWGRETREETADGHERIFGTNYLAHYALTRALLPHLLERRNPRVISVGARQMGASVDFTDFEMRASYDPMQAVLRAKVGLFGLTRSLAQRHAGEGLVAAALDPGLAKTRYQKDASAIMRLALAALGKSPDAVAELHVWLVESDEVSDAGLLYPAPRKPVGWQPWVADDRNVEELWRWSARAVGLDGG